ncbi:MAG: nicotinate-nucleotide--dimethylbenzimidazole phosphoribosyltransferase [Myxococcota bacterium]
MDSTLDPSWTIPTLDEDAANRAAARQNQLTKPRGSLGRLEAIPVQLATIQGTDLPSARPAGAILFAADHPVCRHGVSAYPSEVTAAMVRNFVAGGAAASVMARSLDIPLHVVDVGVAHPYGEVEGASAQMFVDPVSNDLEGDIRVEDALTEESLSRSLAAGRKAVDRLPSETTVLLLGEMGIGNTTLASAMACALLDRDPAEMVGRGTGIDDPALANKRIVVADAVARLRDRNPRTVLRALGGREIAALYGAAGRACERGMAIVVDGFIVSTAILALVRSVPEVSPRLIFAHHSRETGHRAVLEALDAQPLLDLSMALGEASGALAAFSLVEHACLLHAEMATFDEAGVPDKEP